MIRPLTTGADNIVGTAGDDTINGVLTANGQQTFQTWDSIDGGAGVNTLNVQNTGANVLTPTLANIQKLNIQDTTAAGAIVTLNTNGLSTLTNVALDGNGAGSGYVINNLGSLPAVTLAGTGAASTLNFTAAALQPAGQNLNLTLNGVTGGALTLSDTGSNALETVTITSSGAANTLGGLTTSGLGVTTLNIQGSQNLNLGAITDGNATLRTVNASTATGNVTLTAIANSTITGGSGADTFTSSGGSDSMAGGAGNDTFIFGANLDNTDTITGGDGVDALRANDAQLAGYVQLLTPLVTGVETVQVADAFAGPFITANISNDINTVTLRAGGTGVVTFPTTTATVQVGRTDTTAGRLALGDALTGALTVNDTGVLTADTLNLSNSSVDSTTGLGVNAFAGQAINVNGYETVNLNTGITGAANTVGAVTLAGDAGAATTLNIAGSNSLTTAAITAGTINASALGAGAVLTMNNAAVGVTAITGSAGSDTLRGDASSSINGGAGSDTIFGGANNDTLIGGTGNDSITSNGGIDSIDGGAGNDQVVIAGANIVATGVTNGGEGTDRLEITVAADITATNGASVSNFETLRVDHTAAGANNLTLSNFINNTGFTRVEVASAGAGVLSLLNAGSTLNTFGLLTGSQGDSTIFTRLADTTTDSLSIVNMDGTNLTAGGVGAVTAITANNENTITVATDNFNGLTTTSGNITITTLTGNQVATLNVTGASNVELTTLTTAALATVNSTGLTGTFTANAGASNVNLTLNAGTGATTFTSGIGADTLNGGSAADSLTGGAGADRIFGNGGADTIIGGAGADSMTGGSGIDRFTGSATDSVVASASSLTGNLAVGDTLTFGNGVDVITDFVAGVGGDVLVNTTTATTTLVTGIGVATAGGFVTTNTAYFMSGTFNATTGLFTVSADGVGPDTAIVRGLAATALNANTNTVILVGVDSDNLVVGSNFA